MKSTQAKLVSTTPNATASTSPSSSPGVGRVFRGTVAVLDAMAPFVPEPPPPRTAAVARMGDLGTAIGLLLRRGLDYLAEAEERAEREEWNYSSGGSSSSSSSR